VPNLGEKYFTDGNYCLLQLLSAGHFMRKLAMLRNYQQEEKFLNIQLQAYFTDLIIPFIYLLTQCM